MNSFHFFGRAQIDRHFNEFASTDMTIEKLQKIVTCPVEASFKAKWLHWWNASIRERSENKFPIDKPMREKTLDDWLHKASFWAQVYPFLSLLNFVHILLVSYLISLSLSLPHFSWRKKSRSRLKNFKTTSPSISIGTHQRLSCALVSMLIPSLCFRWFDYSMSLT